MSNGPGGPEIRIGDAERDQAVAALGDHYAAGRLTKEEYDERAEQAYAARTRSQIYPLFVDLPRPDGAAASGARDPFSGPSTGRASTQSGTPYPGRGAQARSGPQPSCAGWGGGLRLGWALPVLLVVVAIAILTKVPLLILIFLGWVVLSRTFRGWGHGSSYGRGHYHQHSHGHHGR